MSGMINKIWNNKQLMLIWFIGEIIQIIFFVIGSIMLLWLYAPFTITVKFVLTFIGCFITYDMFKNFVYVRWILWKEKP